VSQKPMEDKKRNRMVRLSIGFKTPLCTLIHMGCNISLLSEHEKQMKAPKLARRGMNIPMIPLNGMKVLKQSRALFQGETDPTPSPP
jgi:hypothetical protein